MLSQRSADLDGELDVKIVTAVSDVRQIFSLKSKRWKMDDRYILNARSLHFPSTDRAQGMYAPRRSA
jgi:hypothetical protein